MYREVSFIFKFDEWFVLDAAEYTFEVRFCLNSAELYNIITPREVIEGFTQVFSSVVVAR